MQRLLVILSIALLSLGISVSAALACTLPPTPTDEATELPRPLVVLHENGEGAYVFGSDTIFALYDTGQVIFIRYNEQSEYELVTVTLDADELAALLETFNIGAEFYALEDHYEASDWTDQATNELCVSDTHLGEKCVSVYGDLHPYCEGCELGDIALEARENTPDVFLNLFDSIREFDHPDAETWIPEVYRATIWEFETSTNRVIELPTEIKMLFDRTGRWTEQSYVIYINRQQYEQLREDAEDSAVVLIDGRTWAFDIRFVYPHEVTSERTNTHG